MNQTSQIFRWGSISYPQAVALACSRISRTRTGHEHLDAIIKAAEELGYPIYGALKNDQTNLVAWKREKASYAFSARRNSIERIGLPDVRNFRLKHLEEEERSFYSQHANKSTVYPDLIPMLILRVEGGRQ